MPTDIKAIGERLMKALNIPSQAKLEKVLGTPKGYFSPDYLGHASVKTTERYIHIDTYCEDDISVTESYTNEARILSNHNNRHNNDT